MANHEKMRKVWEVGDRDSITVWRKINRESQRFTGVAQEEREL